MVKGFNAIPEAVLAERVRAIETDTDSGNLEPYPEIKTLAQPAVVYSFITGFIAYIVLAKAGLQPSTVPMKNVSANA